MGKKAVQAGWVWWLTTLILLKKQRQMNLSEIKASLVHIVHPGQLGLRGDPFSKIVQTGKQKKKVVQSYTE